MRLPYLSWQTKPMERLKAGDPEQIGPWQIVNRLGSGGMGIVYMGTNGTRAAAIKVVRDFLLEDPTSRTRIAREVETLLRVKSEFVAEIVGSDVNGNPAWIATDYVDGPSLKTLVEKEGPLRHDDWLEFAKGFLSAIASVHKVGVVHRDIKPSNVLISKAGPKLIDFGISFTNDATSLTGTGMVAGTPAWLAPEQFLGRAITVAVDNFAAGSTLMYAATGKVPWGAEDSSVGAVMHTILVEEPDTSLLTEFQIDVIMPLLIKDAKNRKSAVQILEKLNSGVRVGKKISTTSPNVDSKATESFLDKARKKDQDDKRRQEEESLKNEKRAKAGEEKLEKRQKRLTEKNSRLAAGGRAEERDQAQSSSASREYQPNVSGAKGFVKPKIVAVVGAVLATGLVSILAFTGGKSDSSGLSELSVDSNVSYNWSALVAGESKSQSGVGNKFAVFVCDQGVVAKSLKVESISPRSSTAGPLAVKVIKGDPRCGANFDTIVVSGEESPSPGSVNYFVSGSTDSNFEFRYDFTVTIAEE